MKPYMTELEERHLKLLTVLLEIKGAYDDMPKNALAVFLLVASRSIEPEASRGSIATFIRCSPPSIVRSVELLEKLGLVEAGKDPANRRLRKLKLSPAGKELSRRINDTLK